MSGRRHPDSAVPAGRAANDNGDPAKRIFARIFENQAARASSSYERAVKLKLAEKTREIAGTRGAETGDHAK